MGEEEVVLMVGMDRVAGWLRGSRVDRGDSKSSSIHSKHTHSCREELNGPTSLCCTTHSECAMFEQERGIRKGSRPCTFLSGRQEYGMAGGRDRTEKYKKSPGTGDELRIEISLSSKLALG